MLLILAGVALSLVAGNEGILTKAETAVTETNIAGAKEQAELMVAEISADYYEKRYVDRDATVRGQKIKDYISGQIGTTGKPSSNGDYVVKVEDGKVTVSDKEGNEIVTGTLEESGKIIWDSAPIGGSGEGGSGETPEVVGKYTVTYDANNGTGVPTDSNEYEKGQTVTVNFVTVPTKEGYEFFGWATSADATEAAYTSTGTTSFTMGEANVILYAVWKQEPKTFASQISTDNYGEYVNLETTILARTDGVITQKLGGSPPTEQPLTDWRIFHKDSSGGVYLILADYLPYSHETTTVGSGLLNNGTSYPYNWRSTTSRTDLIDRLNGTSNSNAWNKLILSTYTDKGITVKGALDLETWVESWNAKGYTELFTNTYSNVNGSAQSDGLDGYYVGIAENPETTLQSVRSDTEGYGNTLYFPHTVNLSNNYGYWLASPSADDTSPVINVYYDGNVYYAYNTATYIGVRPAVYLPSSINAEKNAEGVWEIK